MFFFFSERQEKPYKSRWFAFSALKFLHGKRKCNNFSTSILGADNSSEVNTCSLIINFINNSTVTNYFDFQPDVRQNKDEEIDFEILEDGLATLEGDASLGSTPNNDTEELRYCDKSPRRIDYDQRPKRFKSSHKQETLFDYESLLVPTSNNNTRDECELYGAYLATKLRSYSKQTQTVVQYLMNNILFKADMGYYDNQIEIEEPIRINRYQQNNVTNSSRNIRSPSPSSLGIILPKVEQTERLD